MKQRALQLLSSIGLMVWILMVAVSAKAQNEYRAYIPFDFTMGGKTYKAGNYVIDPLSRDSANTPIAFMNASGTGSQILMAAPGGGYSKVKIATLIFDRLETQYSLAVIKTPSFVVKFRKSNVTPESTLARNQLQPQTIVALTKKN